MLKNNKLLTFFLIIICLIVVLFVICFFNSKKNTISIDKYTTTTVKIDSDVEYAVIENNYYGDCFRGYSVNGKKIKIGIGQFNSGGYSVSINYIEELDEGIIIHIEESSPSPDMSVTMALTCPTITIELKKEYKVLKVINQYNNEL